jgi:hypothetical protein
MCVIFRLPLSFSPLIIVDFQEEGGRGRPQGPSRHVYWHAAAGNLADAVEFGPTGSI